MFTPRPHCGKLLVKVRYRHNMAYCLCIKPGDNNLLHIIQESHLAKQCYARAAQPYHVVAIAQNEPEAYEAAADFVRAFCALRGLENLNAAEFTAWISGDAV